MDISNSFKTAITQFVNVNGHQLAYRLIGDNSDIPLLCLQHFTGNMDGWDPAVIDALSSTRRVILFDNTGVGESEGETPNTVAAMARDTIAFLNALKIEKVDLLGFSLGGFISQLILEEHPQLVRKAILAGTCQQGGKGCSTFRDFLKGSVGIEGADRYLYYFFENSEKSRKLGYALLKRFTERDPKWTPGFRQQTLVAQTEAIVGWGEVPEPANPLLKRIKHQVMIVTGSNDHMFATSNSYEMFQQLPDAILSIYPDASHGSLFQYPYLFTNQALFFLDNEI
ncbi:alpha/beta hydrolase [Mucilaginibacter sp. BJC16-A38]|uniref:alpha/beta fold hydrolase n=1 Tax=Mucilaginibacter phenanthrenivorans TaxID=1234842 RepID=UPI00215811F3|nr:alpha/beta hydrolase [Mucilaginibacter phenanthrenivorans]MCR8560330.1 alpha/beta hydrolase [Mucilaginibacter phenanthrenivorans]